MTEYKPQWPPRPEPVYCAICEQTKHVFSHVFNRDMEGFHEIDVELVCGHRVLTTTQKRSGS